MFSMGWQNYMGYSSFPVYSGGYTPYYSNYYSPNYTPYSFSSYSYTPIWNYSTYNFNTYYPPQYTSNYQSYSPSFSYNSRYSNNYSYSSSPGTYNDYSSYIRYSYNSHNNNSSRGSFNLTSSTSSYRTHNTKRLQSPGSKYSNITNYGPSDIPSGVTIDLAWWKAQGYDEEKGRELSLNAYNKPHKGISGQCVGYTRKTINEVYGTTFENAGAAERFGYKILSSPELKAKGGNFKRFRINGIKPSQVPDGAVLIWPHTAYADKPGSKAALYGHGGIAYDGKVYSNCVCMDLSKCSEIWIPVKA